MIRTRRDRDKDGGVMFYVMLCVMLKIQKILVVTHLICSEITISNKIRSSLSAFFKELGKFVNQDCVNYHNLTVIGEFKSTLMQF